MSSADPEVDLFGEPVPDDPLGPVGVKSRGARLTERQHADIEAGRHPLTGGPTRPDLGTCGDCALRVLIGHNAGTYPKCVQGVDFAEAEPETGGWWARLWASRSALLSHSAATDVRAFWPACPRFTKKETP